MRTAIKNPLLDKNFLKILDSSQERELYVQVIALNFNEDPIESIEGRTTSGNISIDGNSSSRRSCSLSMVAEELNIHNYYWGLNTKFKLLIGLKNSIEPDYPEIIWFKMGTYIISSFNTSQSLNSYTVSLQGKDKMSMLNGEIGGTIMALSEDFGNVDIFTDVNTSVRKKLTLKEIITKGVHTYGNEPFHNIIVNDLDECGVELLEYRGDIPVYFVMSADLNGSLLSQEPHNSFFGSTESQDDTRHWSFNSYWNWDGKKYVEYQNQNNNSIEKLEKEGEITFITQAEKLALVNHPTLFKIKEGEKDYFYALMKVESQMTVGYRPTNLTYAGDLIVQAGAPFTQVLDQIKNMLGNFEYFYDVDGHFIFQRKHNFIDVSWNNVVKNEDSETYVDNVCDTSAQTYNFEDSMIVTSFSNNPALGEIRNDYSIWGVRKGVTGKDIPIHLRYAIDEKPYYYKNYDGKIWVSDEKYGDKEEDIIVRDWREIIYQMALDYFKHHDEDDFSTKIYKNNAHKGLYLNGSTGYECYYTDIQGFWRQLYNPDYTFTYRRKFVTKIQFENNKTIYYVPQECAADAEFNPEERYLVADSYQDFIFSSPTKDEWDANKELADKRIKYYHLVLSDEADEYNSKQSYFIKEDKEYYKDTDNKYWSYIAVHYPEQLNFWFDFLDCEDGALSNYSVRNIGDRPKAENDNSVKAIYFRDTPNVILLNSEDKKVENEDGQLTFEQMQSLRPGYVFLQLPSNLESLFKLSGRGKSAYDVLDNYLYNYAYCSESISLNALPVYYLEPNTRIFVKDKNSGINGEYIINRISYSLDYQGIMSVSATKVADKLY